MRLDGSKSAETSKEAPKVTIEEVSRSTDLVVTASQVKAEQCSDEGKVESVQVGIGGFRIRALYDTGAFRTVMGSIALQLATECGRTFRPASGVGARGAGNNFLRFTGHADLPFELGGVKRDILVFIIPDFEVDCYFGSNFVRAFETMHDPVENRLIVGKSGWIIGLELACVSTTDPKDPTQIRIASIDTMKASSAGLADITL